MPYASQQDLEERFGSAELLDVADRDNDQTVDAAVVDAALTDADELINSYLGRRYDLPLAQVPPALTRVAADVARYLLFKDAPTEVVTANYKAAVQWLRDVADGKAVLDVGGEEPAAAESTVQVTSQKKLFGRGSMEGF